MRHHLIIAGKDLTGAEGMALAAGRLLSTVVSAKTGVHVTVRLTAKRPPRPNERRWQPCSFQKAQMIFADIPRDSALLSGPSPGAYIPGEQVFRENRGADRNQVWSALFALRSAAAMERSPDAYVLQGVNCLHCGRELTDPESITRGLGPECYGKATKSQHLLSGFKPTPPIPVQTTLEVGA